MKKFFKPGPNWLLIFIPISFVLESTHASEPLIFFSCSSINNTNCKIDCSFNRAA